MVGEKKEEEGVERDRMYRCYCDQREWPCPFAESPCN